MARATRTRRKRRRARYNPTSRQVVTWAGAAAAAGIVGYGAYRLSRSRRPKFELPEPPQGVGEPTPIGCELGPSYPGFVQDASGACVPTDATPPGFYVDVACADFVYVDGDVGEQPDDLDATISTLVQFTKDPTKRAADPTHNVTQFLQKFWPACTWPPVSGTPRLQQMFIVLSFLMGREIVRRGGRVLGTGDLAEVDERVATRLAQLGMPVYDPSIVPEIPLPSLADELDEASPEPGPGPGPDVDEPGPKQGGIDLPPGGQQIPGQQPPAPQEPVDAQLLPLKPCQKFPYAPPAKKNIEVEPARWTGPSTHDFLLFDLLADDNAECRYFNLRFGLCLRATASQIFGLFDPTKPTAGVHLRNEDTTPVDWSTFHNEALWKRQYRTRVGIKDGKTLFDPPTPIIDPGVDPCSNDPVRWPVASNGTFIVDVPPLGEISPMQLPWKPTPKVTLVAKGRKIYARLSYTGMPQFLLGGADPQFGGIDVPDEWNGELVANRFQTTTLRADYKVWALGAYP